MGRILVTMPARGCNEEGGQCEHLEGGLHFIGGRERGIEDVGICSSIRTMSFCHLKLALKME